MPSVMTEMVPLPSRGLVYPKRLEIPKEIPIRPYNTEDQKGLYGVGGNYGVDMLIDNCINIDDKKFKAEDLLTTDKALIILRLRAITLGKDYPVDYTCPVCGRTVKKIWDLDQIPVNYLETETYPIEIELPSGKNCSLRFLTDKDLEEVEDHMTSRASKFEDFDKDNERRMYRRAAALHKVEGAKMDLQSKREWYGQLSSEDSAYIDFILNELDIGPYIRDRIRCTFEGCKADFDITLRTGIDFFRPKFKLPKGLGIKKATLAGYSDPAVPAGVLREHQSGSDEQDDPDGTEGNV